MKKALAILLSALLLLGSLPIVMASEAPDLNTVENILAAAQALRNGESLQKEVTLTGKVLDIETPYDAAIENITVNIRVQNVDIKCYRLTGNGVANIKPSDTIIVKGIIKNYMDVIEFDVGSEMTKRVAGSGGAAAALSVVSSPKVGVAYKFGMVQENVYLNDAAADVNRDGEVNNRDYGLLLQYVNGWDVTLG